MAREKCSTSGEGTKFIQNFILDIPLRRLTSVWKDDIEMHLNKKDTEWCENWNGSERVRIIRPMMGNFKKK